VDPKRLELNLYENIPHLIAPVVTDPKIASNVLRNATREMENRLKLLAQRGVRTSTSTTARSRRNNRFRSSTTSKRPSTSRFPT